MCCGKSGFVCIKAFCIIRLQGKVRLIFYRFRIRKLQKC